MKPLKLLRGATRFCEVLKIRGINHMFNSAMPAAGVAIAPDEARAICLVRVTTRWHYIR